jgi:hypothetical protein
MSKKFRRKHLACGCCGIGFYTWPEYVDQDQDLGYGICMECQADAEKRNNELLDESAMLIEEKLNPINKKKFQNMSVEARRWLAWKAHEDGMFTWRIGK